MERDIKVFAPGRVELLGNHTDYNNGYVLALPLGMGITISGRKRSDGLIVLESKTLAEKFSIKYEKIKPQKRGSFSNYVLGVIDQLQRGNIKLGGFSAVIESDLPIGAGLASSAALEIATIKFLKKLFQFKIEKNVVAKMAQAAEHNYVGVKCGLLDQISSLYGKKGESLLIDFQTLTTENIPVPEDYKFIIVHSQVKHSLVAGEYNERRNSCENAAKKIGVSSLRDANFMKLNKGKRKLSNTEYKRAKHVVGENHRVLKAVEYIKRGDIKKVGELMFISHQSSIDNFENSSVELDFLVNYARNFDGCLGARLSGGGFGGATINVVKGEQADNFRDSIAQSYLSEFKIDPKIFLV